jgi:hypothetical protein
MFQKIYEDAFKDELEKIAEDNPEKNINFLKGRLGAARALSIGGKARNLIAEPEYIKQRLKQSGKNIGRNIGIGTAVGAGLGAIATGILSKKMKLTKGNVAGMLGLGSLMGSLGGVDASILHGTSQANKDILKEKGITYTGKYLPRGFHFTNEAKKKYRVE